MCSKLETCRKSFFDKINDIYPAFNFMNISDKFKYILTSKDYDLNVFCMSSIFELYNGPVYKTNLVRTNSLSDHGPDQIWLCKRYLLVPKIWSGPKSGPKRDLLMCKDHGPIEFGPVPYLDM